MEIKVLRNFLAVAELGNMTYAAESLMLSQPALSTQIKALEKELGKQLFTRHSRHLELTPEGQLLKERAENILEITDKTLAEFQSLDQLAGGEISIGAAETHLMSSLAEVFTKFKKEHPLVTFNLFSGGTEQVLEKLNSGVLDIAVIVEPPRLDRYHYLKLPGTDRWGAVLPRHHPLASKPSIRVEDLLDQELIISKQSREGDLPRWAGQGLAELKFSGHYNLAYNGAVFAKAGLGIMLSFENLVECSKDTGLAFVPLEPALTNESYLIWQKQHRRPPLIERFLEQVEADFRQQVG